MLPSTLNVAHYLMGKSLKQPEQEVCLVRVVIHCLYNMNFVIHTRQL